MCIVLNALLVYPVRCPGTGVPHCPGTGVEGTAHVTTGSSGSASFGSPPINVVATFDRTNGAVNGTGENDIDIAPTSDDGIGIAQTPAFASEKSEKAEELVKPKKLVKAVESHRAAESKAASMLSNGLTSENRSDEATSGTERAMQC